MKKSFNRGFTLIELMIVVAIVAVLTSIAYPAYTSSILKGKRAEGRAALAELIQQQERYMTQRNCYLGFSTAANGVATAIASTTCGVTTATAVPFKTFSGDTLANAAYLLSAEACPSGTAGTNLLMSDCVRVVATPIRTDAEAGTLRITSTGTKDCVNGTNPSVCWK